MRKIRIFQWITGIFFALTAGLYVNFIPAYYDKLTTQCIAGGCGLSVPALTLGGGLSNNETALILLAIDCAFTLVFYVAAGILLWKGSREPMGLLAAIAMVSFGTSFPSLVMVSTEPSSFAHHWFNGVSAVGWISISLFCFLFPNGRFVPSWSRYAMGVIAVVDVGTLLAGTIWRTFGAPEYVQFLWYVSSTLLLIYVQVRRFRSVSSPEERQQTKWVVYGVAVGFVGFGIVSTLFDPRFYNSTALNFIYLNAVLHLFLSAMPITLTLAVLRRRLWDINPLVNRTLVYGALTVGVALLYTAVVLYLSNLFENWNHFVISLIATGLVAATFGPMKEWLQRQVNRLMKGRHDDPYAVLLELGNRLMEPLAPVDMLIAIAKQVREALRLPYAGIAIDIEGKETLIAEAGERREGHELHAYPIIYRGRTLGNLYAAGRSTGETFTAEDNLFLEVMLRHAGPLVNNADMLQGMRKLTEDLQESREKLVLAREEERRRIRNNLHDDLAPKLAGLALKAATARKYVDKDPTHAITMLDTLSQTIRSSIQDIRALVNNLRPPALDELGLIGAVRARMDDLAQPAQLASGETGATPLLFQLESPPSLPSLRAAVEVAAYRIATESIVNTVKHANATVCRVRLEVTDSRKLLVEITDNGIGVAHQPAWSGASGGGIGLLSMRERSAEIGGEFGIERLDTGGTRVWALLPL
ncbi:MAG: sensor histidine kinase [Cohnella sp.]|nr:sensor histidine kinase [Cohnella sp.]